MGLLDPTLLRNLKGLTGLLAETPIGKYVRGKDQGLSVEGLKRGLLSIPVFENTPEANQTAYEAAMNIGPLGLGKIVYHGSPHKFDKFDASKIGTGEGAQAYGHGIYMADDQKVAKTYAEQVKDMAKIDAANKEMSRLSKVMEADQIPGQWRKYRTDAGRFAAEQYDALMASKMEPGALYKADLPDEWIPKMLDWDKPLSQQPEALASLNSLADKLPRNVVVDVASGKRVKSTLTGRDFYNRVAGNPDPLSAIGPRPAAGRPIMGAAGAPGIMEYDEMGQAAAARLLGMGGIPGIRYLDGGSRGKGQGTYNYVVFPGLEDQVKILERNGVPLGLLGGK